MIENPFEPPAANSDEQVAATQSSFSQPWMAILLALAGALIGAILCSVGYLAVVILLDLVFVPPLHSPENYGQFGFLLIYFGFFGLLFGASFGLLAYIRFSRWLLVFALITAITFQADADLLHNFNITEVTSFSMVIVALLIVISAWITSAFIHQFGRQTAT